MTSPLAALLIVLAIPGAARSEAGPALTRPMLEAQGVGFESDLVVLQLTPAAAIAAWPARDPLGVSYARPSRITSLGLPDIDQVGSRYGAWYEPEFAGVGPPDPMSTGADLGSFWIAHLAPGSDSEGARTAFATLPEVAVSSLSANTPVEAIPNDSLWSKAYYFYQPPSRRDIHGPEAWDVATGDTSIIVGVIDTGVLPYHPDLGPSPGHATDHIWHNWAEVNGQKGVDDDHNGFVDDTWGWDFVSLPNPVETGVKPGEDWSSADNDPNDFASHGTAVAGVIGAISNNSIGVTGTVWNVRIMALRIGWSTLSFPVGLVNESFAAQAIVYGAQNGARVLNCSFSNLFQSDLSAALDYAQRSGVTVVTSAGNSGSNTSELHFIGDRDETLAVAATDQFDQIPLFSNTGSFVDVAAPGISLATTICVDAGPDSIRHRQPGYTLGASGTSFSSPVAAGAVALYQGNRLKHGLPLAHPIEAVLRIVETADDITARNPTKTGYGSGRVNLSRVVSDPPTSAVLLPESRMIGAGVALPWTDSPCCAAVATTDGHIQIIDVKHNAVAQTISLSGPPTGGIAAADLGGGHGFGMFVGTQTGWIDGFDENGLELPGWPVHATGASLIQATPALGDLDGDGVLEVLWGGNDGRLYAWNWDGTPRGGNFPVSLGEPAANIQFALSDLDGEPGVEIAAASWDEGMIAVFHGDGSMSDGWPLTLGGPTAHAPVITRFGKSPEPTVIVTLTYHAFALDPHGVVHGVYYLAGDAVGDPALADLDGNGVDDIILGRQAPTQIAVLDSSVRPVKFGSWPKRFGGSADGMPLVGLVGPRAEEGVVWNASGSGVLGLDSSGTQLHGFPKPGHGAAAPSIDDFDGDGRTEILSGAPSGPGIFIYRLGPGTAIGPRQSWPTARGNYARTGSRLYSPGIRDLTPVELALVDATARTDAVSLEWYSSRDRVSSVTIERRAGQETWRDLAVIEPDGTGHLRYEDRNVESGRRYAYRLRVNGSEAARYYGEVTVEIPSGVAFSLAGASPNPAPGAFTLGYSLPTAEPARLEILDLAGRRMIARDLQSGPGNHRTLIPEAGSLPPGIYLMRVAQGRHSQSSRIAIVH